jgi:hypothetical protein
MSRRGGLLIVALVPTALLDSPSYHDPGGVMAIKPPQILVAFGIVLVILAIWETVRRSERCLLARCRSQRRWPPVGGYATRRRTAGYSAGTEG